MDSTAGGTEVFFAWKLPKIVSVQSWFEFEKRERRALKWVACDSGYANSLDEMWERDKQKRGDLLSALRISLVPPSSPTTR
jgi:hypothetical protein